MSVKVCRKIYLTDCVSTSSTHFLFSYFAAEGFMYAWNLSMWPFSLASRFFLWMEYISHFVSAFQLKTELKLVIVSREFLCVVPHENTIEIVFISKIRQRICGWKFDLIWVSQDNDGNSCQICIQPTRTFILRPRHGPFPLFSRHPTRSTICFHRDLSHYHFIGKCIRCLQTTLKLSVALFASFFKYVLSQSVATTYHHSIPASVY